MKPILVVSSILALATSTFAQKRIPEVVKTAFAKGNPSATNLKWDKESTGDFEANCKNNAIPMSFVYSPAGELLETETEINASAFPPDIAEAIRTQFPKAKIKGGAIIVSNKGVTQYEADLQIGKRKMEKKFDSEGNLSK